ncbi:hypothetical protein HPP92_011558 [Vanilla planifolia]|uniref:Uncharacterized protein n=1 Tax=Vanilla planifolia TaxID=51239 RepID=A0A835V148_VANPL|nr:hypothetical protein HPP92_011558 [Vanilla planifolia]
MHHKIFKLGNVKSKLSYKAESWKMLHAFWSQSRFKNREEEAKGIDVIQMCLTESSLKEETAVNPIRCRITFFMVIKDVRDLRGKSGFFGFQAMQLWASRV